MRKPPTVCFTLLSLNLGPAIATADQETEIPALVGQASGVVLELGPGIGSQLPRYDKTKITKVYGVEPCQHLHEALREKVKSSGLTDVYEIVTCGIQDVEGLQKHGVTREMIDTVLSVQVLCSVSDPDQVMRQLYAMMKPGGQFIVYEHVKSNDSLSRVVQSRFSPFLKRSSGIVLSVQYQTFTTLSGPFSLVTAISIARLCSPSRKLASGARPSLPFLPLKMHVLLYLVCMASFGRPEDVRRSLQGHMK